MRAGVLLPIFVATLLSSSAAWAEREPWERRWDIEWFANSDPEWDIDLCVFLPYASCVGMIEGSIGYGGGRGYGTRLNPGEPNDYQQLYGELGYLFRVVESPSLQIGPTIGFEADFFDESIHYSFFASARGRLWLGNWVTLGLALGVVGSLDDSWKGRGIGGLGELGMTLGGHIGVYVHTQVLYGRDGVETRVTGGVRGSLLTWAAIILGLGG